MRRFESKFKNGGYFIYRLVAPIFDPLKFVRGLYGYLWFLRDLISFQRKSGTRVLGLDLYPILSDRSKFTPFDAHYFYQQLWVFENVLKNRPELHVDVASTYELSGYLSKIVKTKFVDLRPIEASLPNLEVEKGDILDLPFSDSSIESLSCLHVIEHIGLGRYGDAIDPRGREKACRELERVLAPGGSLFLSTPIGEERVCFNAHWVSSPQTIINYFQRSKLVAFNVVDDNGSYKEGVDPVEFSDLSYGCGMFLFRKLAND